MNYGIIELAITIVGFVIFYIWQRKSLKRDMEQTRKRIENLSFEKDKTEN